jgi:hypothetical protein
MFVCPANTFDNVKGSFPIGFMVWNTNKTEKFSHTISDVYDKEGKFSGTKGFSAYVDSQYINDWIKPLRASKNDKSVIGKFPFKGNDFQNQNMIAIVNSEAEYNVEAGQFLINETNLIMSCIYFAVRKVIPADWLNDRDQFLYPNDGWKTDLEFQNDCLAYTLFSNNIRSKYGINDWIPFTEYQIGARDNFYSHFMTDFMEGKTSENTMLSEPMLFYGNSDETGGSSSSNEIIKREFSEIAKNVFMAGRDVWRYYHLQKSPSFEEVDAKGGRGGYNANASLYDIREYFQGRNDNGKMNNKSDDEPYNELIGNLREALKTLAAKIEPKVYEYGFLKK